MADQAQGESVCGAGVTPVQLVEGPPVSAREAPMQLEVVPGAVVHEPYPRRAMAPSTLHHVVLYARPGCHLCDVARTTIGDVRSRHPFTFEEVDIEEDEALVREYGIRIPVVMVDGQEVFEVDVQAGHLAALVRT